jgi:hypothetical protein
MQHDSCRRNADGLRGLLDGANNTVRGKCTLAHDTIRLPCLALLISSSRHTVLYTLLVPAIDLFSRETVQALGTATRASGQQCPGKDLAMYLLYII